MKLLVFGFGNPGRLDDGLGPAFTAAVGALALDHVETEADYQLTVEDAQLVAGFDVVLFVDAAVRGTEPFYLVPVTPDPEVSFSSHSVSPAQVYHLARSLFDADTRAYVLGIRGYDYNEFGERLSARAAANLDQALAFFRAQVEAGLDLDNALRGSPDEA